MSGITYAVVTKVPEPTGPEGGGNLATALDQVFVKERPENMAMPFGRFGVLPMGVALLSYIPVFTLGEVLLLGPDGRELTGRGRKPSKWSVEIETFLTAEAAVIRAREVQDHENLERQESIT
jgi:hypothetical protein